MVVLPSLANSISQTATPQLKTATIMKNIIANFYARSAKIALMEQPKMKNRKVKHLKHWRFSYTPLELNSHKKVVKKLNPKKIKVIY